MYIKFVPQNKEPTHSKRMQTCLKINYSYFMIEQNPFLSMFFHKEKLYTAKFRTFVHTFDYITLIMDINIQQIKKQQFRNIHAHTYDVFCMYVCTCLYIPYITQSTNMYFCY